MGGHYGSIHIRTEDRDVVLRALDKFEVNRTRRFLVAPPIDGWVTVFPEHNGQDSSVFEALAAKLPNLTLVCCLVHDDDVFAYWLIDGGRVLDTYNSCPDYFGSNNPPPRGGNAKSFSILVRDSEKVDQLQKLLDADRFAFELERQDKFAEILGLPNTAYAYEYLQAGETDGVRQWKKFIHVPDLAPEKEAKRAARAKLKSDLEQLLDTRVMFVDEPGQKGKVKGRFNHPIWTVNPATSEVVMAWQDSATINPQVGQWRQFSSANWREGACNWPAAADAVEVKISRSGKLLAEISRSGTGLNVWNLPEGRLVVTKSLAGAAGLTFSSDERFLLTVVRKYPPPSVELHRIALGPGLEDGVLVAEDNICFNALAVHPDGLMAAVIDNFGVLIVVDLPQMKIANEVWIKDTKSRLPLEEIEQIVAQTVAELNKHLSQSEVDAHVKSSRRHHIPKESIRVCLFSPDGRFLFCGTHDGVRVIEWDDVLRCGRMQPVRVRSGADTEALAVDRGGFSTSLKIVYGLVYDATRNRLIFCGVEGKIKFLDLDAQTPGDLITVPGQLAIVHLELTADRSALIATATRLQFKGNDPTPSRFQVWNYRALCERNNISW